MLADKGPFVIPVHNASTTRADARKTSRSLSAVDTNNARRTLIRPITTPFLARYTGNSTRHGFDTIRPLHARITRIGNKRFTLTTYRLARLARRNRHDKCSPSSTFHAIANTGENRRTVIDTRVATFNRGTINDSPSRPARAMLTKTTQRNIITTFFRRTGNKFCSKSNHTTSSPLSAVYRSNTGRHLIGTCLIGCCNGRGSKVSLARPVRALPAGSQITLIRIIRIPSALAPRRVRNTQHYTTFVRRRLPRRFGSPTRVIVINNCILISVALHVLRPPRLGHTRNFPRDCVVSHKLFISSTANTRR